MGDNFNAFRLDKDPKSSIKVVLNNSQTKARIMKSKKRYEMTIDDLGYRGNNKVFMNHDLTKNLELYMAAKQFKHD